MPDDDRLLDEQIIHDAYADRVKDAFKTFAENLGMGENENSLRERFARALEMTRKARDLALQAVTGSYVADPNAARSRFDRAPEAGAALSAEEQAIINQAVSGTTGHRTLPTSADAARFGRSARSAGER